MKIKLIAILLLTTGVAHAQVPSYIEETKALGAVAGQGLACKSSKFDQFELLARALLITKASSDQQQEAGMKSYNEAKADAFISKQMDGFYMCSDINNRFDSQEIFKLTLYADGTIKTPNGEILTPRQPYDANFLYSKDIDTNERAAEIFNKRGNQKVDVTVKDDRL